MHAVEQTHEFAETRSSPVEPTSTELQEMQTLALAERLLARDPARALELARAGDKRFPHGYFVEERQYIVIMALFHLGRIDEARARADDFLRAYPRGPFAQKVRSRARR